LHLRVLGDGTGADAKLGVFPAGARVVVFDVDGTLTTEDPEVQKEVLDALFADVQSGDRVPEARPGGKEVTRAWAAHGTPIVYITGRPYWLTAQTRRWLQEGGFAPGYLRTTDDHLEVLPTPGGVGAFKAKTLSLMVSRGLEIEAAYGNALTDVGAYEKANVPKDRSFIVGPHAGAGGTQALKDGYGPHLAWVEKRHTLEPTARAK
jgi:phosphatidate phosphatase PAH1